MDNINTSLDMNALQLLDNLLKGNLSLADFVISLFKAIGNLWSYKLLITDGQPITVANVVIGLILFVLGLRLAKYLSIMVRRKLLNVLDLDQSSTDSLQKISHYIFILFITLIVLDIANVPIKSFTVVGGALAFGIGFGSQNIFSNFISGLIMMVERPIKIGDLIEVNNTTGRVVNIGARCVHLRTGSNVDILVPNSYMLQNNIVNWTLEDNVVRVTTNVAVNYNTPAKIVEKLVRQALDEQVEINLDPAPQVFLTSFAENVLNFEVNFWVNLASISERKQIISNLNHRIIDLFSENNITLALPQRKVIIEDRGEGEPDITKVVY
jgi:small-conductance mechanosensitive channel